MSIQKIHIFNPNKGSPEDLLRWSINVFLADNGLWGVEEGCFYSLFTHPYDAHYEGMYKPSLVPLSPSKAEALASFMLVEESLINDLL